jgi:adenylate cyclase 3
VLFLWKKEVEAQSERASDMRRRNEALVYNILPPHVAAHFMGSRKRQHEELYSQSYSEVGVLFASMPNFTGTYRLLRISPCPYSYETKSVKGTRL